MTTLADAGAPAASVPSRARDWILAISGANIFYLRTWAAVLEKGRNVTPTALLIGIVNVAILAVCFHWAYVHIRSSPNKWVRWCGIVMFAGLLLIPFHAITTIYFAEQPAKRNAVYAAGLLAGAAIIATRHVRSLAVHVLMLLSPFVLMTFGQCLWRAAAYDPARWSIPARAAAPTGRTARLLWVIFDEWDYGLTFDTRPKWLRTPEVDRLNAISFHAAHAVPPGDRTEVSMPRLLTGDRTSDKQHLSELATIFTKAKAEGYQPAVSGWYLDYCGALSKPLAECWSTNADPRRYSMGSQPMEIAANQFKNLFENQFRSPFGQSLGTKRHAIDYEIILRGALAIVSNPAFNLVFVHLPVPHPPFFYNRITGHFDLNNRPLIGLIKKDFSGYFDAIQLVDLTIGKLRSSLESAGLWDRTHLLISSDHPLRNRVQIDGVTNEERVPFIVRVAGVSEEVTYAPRFNTIVSSELAMALLRGELHTPAEVRARIEQRMTTSN